MAPEQSPGLQLVPEATRAEGFTLTDCKRPVNPEEPAADSNGLERRAGAVQSAQEPGVASREIRAELLFLHILTGWRRDGATSAAL